MKQNRKTYQLKPGLSLKQKAKIRDYVMSHDKTIVKATYSAIDDCLIVTRNIVSN